ncbi:hypothetical protein CCR97_15205 [Rhodoplanes elegans]|uniref:DUF4169 domain-containing protein n=1 Tax=Rhodoplanes elegans TaxID=29408 RepID=A0A327K9S2_9BRAD|nr:DUF4169 family protein [Rhodoplanes elegans]MBK5959542.1 hypothetical protein [Rhodoplanes elegans]RAI34062.1 hypothetical protein CH338_21525 [Rhodoplanes elegans]
MGEIVNLRRVRKRKDREDAAERAGQNRVLHGMPKAERTVLAARKDKANRALDQHRLETGEGE